MGSDLDVGWAETVETARVRMAFLRYVKERGMGSWAPSANQFGRLMTSVCPSMVRAVKGVTVDGKQTTAVVYKFRPLAAVRQEWAAKYPGLTPWKD